MTASLAKTWAALAVGPNRVMIDPSVGNIRALRLSHAGRTFEPLHTAPWLEEGADLPADMFPVERYLAGDFFCAPFGASDVQPAPAHGWPANSQWQLTGLAGNSLHLTLVQPVLEARIAKTLSLVADAPILFQEHRIEGGSGQLTVAHHPMIRLAGRARLSCSPKRAVVTDAAPLDPGRNRLAPGTVSAALTAVPAADGGVVDLTRLPIADRHEDFVTLVEAPGATLGWTAVVREVEEDVIFVLKDARILPVTMLWHSNGGRDRAPWNGRHRGVLGIEDGCAAGSGGHAAALAANPVSALGVPTTLALAPGRVHRIAQAVGAISRPRGWSMVQDIRIDAGACILTGDDGTRVALPFAAGFLEESQ